jgi:hypothetical protein
MVARCGEHVLAADVVVAVRRIANAGKDLTFGDVFVLNVADTCIGGNGLPGQLVGGNHLHRR